MEVLWGGGLKNCRLSELAIFRNFSRHIFETFRVEANIIMLRYEVVYGLCGYSPGFSCKEA